MNKIIDKYLITALNNNIYYFDNNNTLVLIFPRFEPLVEEDGEFRFSEEEIISIL